MSDASTRAAAARLYTYFIDRHQWDARESWSHDQHDMLCGYSPPTLTAYIDVARTAATTAHQTYGEAQERRDRDCWVIGMCNLNCWRHAHDMTPFSLRDWGLGGC